MKLNKETRANGKRFIIYLTVLYFLLPSAEFLLFTTIGDIPAEDYFSGSGRFYFAVFTSLLRSVQNLSGTAGSQLCALGTVCICILVLWITFQNTFRSAVSS